MPLPWALDSDMFSDLSESKRKSTSGLLLEPSGKRIPGKLVCFPGWLMQIVD